MGQKEMDEEALQEFLLDIECLDDLLPWTRQFNLFDVLKLARAEIRHSNVLAWLLDANENHGIGDKFIEGFVRQIIENASDSKYDVFSLLLMDFHSFTVYREWKNIDILLVSEKEKKLIAIENKVGSQEHSNQLNRYREILEKTYSEYQRILIYLTTDGEEPSDKENWKVSTYSDVVEILETVCERMELNPDIELMVRNYMEIIRREVVEDQQLIEICNKIYHKHKRALDLIFEHRTDDNSRMKDMIAETLMKLQEDGEIILKDNVGNSRYFFYSTKRMTDYLGELDNNNGVWNTASVYYYWIHLEKDAVSCAFELGGWNLTEEQKMKMHKLIKHKKPNDTRLDFKFKKVYSQRCNITESEYDEDLIRGIVCGFVKRLKEKETELLEALS